ncbi:MAG: hypothetical protein NTY66_01435 [Candidatus Vogelbacteria bacterium]|nr:hypothetical protein [Candidatus Vogelbacteria bacterium]
MILISLCAGLVLAAYSSVVLAEMNGTTYKIDSDSINSGGIDYSFSGDYSLADTVGEIAIGDSTSTNYEIGAGYRQMDDSSVSIGVSLQNIILAPELGGLTGGTSTGATQITVTTDSPAGYLITLQAEDSPAMQSDYDTIADYSPQSSDPDYELNLVAGQSFLAFTPEGSDIVDRFRDGGGICGVIGGSDSANRCWDGMAVTSKTIVNRTSRTEPDGATTTLRFSVGVGVNRVQVAGTYLATSTITALAL